MFRILYFVYIPGGDDVSDIVFTPDCLKNVKRHDPKQLKDLLSLNLEADLIEESPCRPEPGTVLVYRKGTVEINLIVCKKIPKIS